MKKLGLLVLALVIALGALGMGYAYWQQTLIINAEVGTALFDVNFTGSETRDNAPPELVGVQDYTQGRDAQIWIRNAYPSYAVEWTLLVTNQGTIPVRITLTGVNVSPELDFAVLPPGSILVPPGATIPFLVLIHVNNLAVPGATYGAGATYLVEQFNAPAD